MRIFRWLVAILLVVLYTIEGFSQQLHLGNSPAASTKSAVLELHSTNQGLLFTRIADTALINTLNPPDGMVVYYTPAKRLLLRANGAWQSLASVTTANSWAYNGNTVGAQKTIGTIDNYDLPIITNNTERMRISSTGDVAIGTNDFDSIPEKLVIDAGVTDSYNLLVAKGSRNGYLQFNIQNNSSQGQASTDIVATANNGTENSNYVNLGINGGGYNNGNNILSGANNGYLFGAGQDFIIGNSSTSKNLILFTGGIATSNERMRITSAGRVGIGTTSPATTLDVAGTYKLGSSGTALNNMIKTSFSITDNGAFGLGTTKVVTATVSGATTGATVILNPRSQLPTAVAIAYSYVSSANTVTIGFICSQTVLGSSSLGSITFDVTLIQ